MTSQTWKRLGNSWRSSDGYLIDTAYIRHGDQIELERILYAPLIPTKRRETLARDAGRGAIARLKKIAEEHRMLDQRSDSSS